MEDDDSVRDREDDIVLPDPAPSVDPSQPPLSRREARLRMEREKIADIARQQRIAEQQAKVLARAEELKAAADKKEFDRAERERHQEQINISQPIPRLDGFEQTATGWAPPQTPVDTVDPVASTMGWLPAPGEQGPVLGVTAPDPVDLGSTSSRKRRDRKAPKVKRAKVKRVAGYRKVKGLGRGFVFLVVGALFVSLGLPASGFRSDSTPETIVAGKQSLKTTNNGTGAENVALGEYYVTSYGEYLAMTYGSGGQWNYNVVNSGKVRWPFPMVVPIASGFGSRVAPCFACSSYHEGMDFDPAEGTPFFAVADGVVTEVHDDLWGLGKWVVIHHEVGSNIFDSLYAHMLRDSTGVKVGDEVKVGDYIGRVGNSGTSTGAHLHFQIMVDGTPIDPFPFMKKYTLGNKSPKSNG